MAARDPPWLGRAIGVAGREISVRLLLLPSLIAYGLLVSSQSGGRAIPCLWRFFLGFRCPGCGLSRANAFLVFGDVGGAVAMNWLIVPLWLVAIHSFFIAVVSFNREVHHG